VPLPQLSGSSVVVGVIFASVLQSAPCPAQETTSPVVALEYQAPDGCPTPADFRAALAERGIAVGTGVTLSKVDVRITNTAAGYGGALVISAVSGTSLDRRLEGKDCAELASAFALIAAVTVAPDSASNSAAGAVDNASPGAPAAATATTEDAAIAAGETAPPAKQPPAVTPPKRAAQRTLKKSPTIVEPAPDDAAAQPIGELSSTRKRPAFGLGAGALVHDGALPEVGAGVLVYSDLEWNRVGVLWPSLFISAAWSRETVVRVGSARFDWFTLAASFCPWRWPTQGLTKVRACAALQGGVLNGSGLGVESARSSMGAWFAGGAGPRAETRLGKFVLGLAAEATLPFVRDRFFFNPDIDVHRASWIVFDTSLTVGLRFD
jgi:hypothetical protein